MRGQLRTARGTAAVELRRMTAGRLPRMALVALAVIPLLYAGLYLWANSDPYGRLDQVPAALVVQDEGAAAQGTLLSVGSQVADDLEDGDTLDWQRTDAADAAEGVRDGRYEAVLTIPASFSADLATVQAAVQAGDPVPPRQAQLELTTNDATSYIGRTIAERVVAEARQAVVTQVGEQTADGFLVGFSTVSQQLAQAGEGAGELTDGLTQAGTGAQALTTGTAALADGQRALAQGADGLADGAGQLSDGVDAAAEGSAALAEGVEQLDTGAAALADGLGELRTATSALPDQTRQLADGAAAVADGNAQVAATGDQLAQASAQAVAGLDGARGDLAAQLAALGLTPEQSAAVLEQVDGLAAPVREADAQVQAATGQLDALAQGSRGVADGAALLADATPALTGGIATAADGSDALAAGSGQLAEGTTALAEGAPALAQGAQALVEGSTQLADGQAQAVDGAQQAADGAAGLAEGITGLGEGATALRDGLVQGAAGVPDLDDDARGAAVGGIVDPVAVSSTSEAEVGSYGAGLAPFFLALATWIGGYALFLVLRPLSRRALAAGRPSLGVALGGWAPAALVGVVQAVLLWLVVVLALTVDPAHPWGLLGVLVLTSAAFIAVLHALNAGLGRVGQFVGLVLLVLQLVSSGGTFPWQTLPGPLAALHQVLPMGYAVDAMRRMVAGGALTPVVGDVLVLLAFGVAGVAASTLVARRRRVWTVAGLRPALG